MTPISAGSRLCEGVRAIDSIVAKSIGVSELARAARIETLQRKFLESEWDKLARQAMKTARAELRKRDGPITVEDQDRVVAVVGRTMAQWAGRVTDRHLKDLREIYELAHIAAARKALGYTDARMDFTTPKRSVEKAEAPAIKPSFDTLDRRALAALEKRQKIWIGKHYDDNVERQVRSSVRTSMPKGIGRIAAGKALDEDLARTLGRVRIPKGFNGSNASYFEGLAAHAATQARASAQLNVFRRTGYTMYEIVNPQDHRTCERCQAMDGHVFYVKDGMTQLSRLARTSTPEGVKRAAPYLSRQRARTMTTGPKGTPKSTRGLARLGIVMSPFHFKCRCNMDVTPDAEPPNPEDIPIKGNAVSVPKKPLMPRVPSEIPLKAPDHETLKPDIAKAIKGWGKAEKTGDYKAVRRHVEGMLKKHWGVTQYRGGGRTVRKMELLPKYKLPKFAGYHDWRGLIVLREDIAEKVLEGFITVRVKGTPTAGLNTLIHEVIHGADRMRSAAYAGGGAVITEVSTELLSRKIAFELSGDTIGNPVFAQAFSRAYQRHIRNVRQVLSEVTDWPLKRIDSEMIRASHLMHTGKAGMATRSPNALVKKWVRNLPGHEDLTATQRNQITKAISTMEKDW